MGGNFPGEIVLEAIVWGGIVWWEIILWGNCPGGNCPRTSLQQASDQEDRKVKDWNHEILALHFCISHVNHLKNRLFYVKVIAF